MHVRVDKKDQKQTGITEALDLLPICVILLLIDFLVPGETIGGCQVV
jgi:hypothetical protein